MGCQAGCLRDINGFDMILRGFHGGFFRVSTGFQLRPRAQFQLIFNRVSTVFTRFVTSGVELLWGNCTVFPVPVQGILTGAT